MLKSKTLWTGAAAIVAAAGSYFMQEIQLAEMLQIVITSLLAIFVRHGVHKSAEAAK